MALVPFHDLRDFLIRLLRAAGAGGEDAATVADHLARSDLAGHPSHGTVRIPQYVQMVREGTIVPGGRFTVEHETAATAVARGGWNFGQVGCRRAMDLSIAKARQSGLAAVTLSESAHVGRLGAYAEQAAAAGMVSIIAVNNHGANPVMAPHGGAEGRLSPEAMAWGVPKAGFPLVQDMSLTVIPEGKVRVARNEGQRLPPDCLLDNRGNPSTDPNDFYGPPRGALLPLGGPVGYKGFGLAVMVDILAGALSGAGCTLPGRTRTGNGVFILTLGAGALSSGDRVSGEVEALCDWIKSCPLRPGASEVLLPGEVEARNSAQALERGIAVGAGTWSKLLETARELGIAPLELLS
jgi:uncharacterized oxidoreductase